MPEDDFYVPTDADELRMENELLAYEAQFLRAMLADPFRQVEEFRAKLEEARKETQRIRRDNAQLRQRRQEMKEKIEQLQKADEDYTTARRDLVRLLESLSGGATGIANRRNEVFTELREKYL